jgi:hypothetical protein
MSKKSIDGLTPFISNTVYGNYTTLSSNFTATANTSNQVVTTTLTSPGYGSTWRVCVDWLINFVSGGNNTYSAYVLTGTGMYCAQSTTSTTSSGYQTGFSGGGYSQNQVGPSSNMTVTLYFYPNVTTTVKTDYLTSLATTYLQVIWVAC